MENDPKEPFLMSNRVKAEGGIGGQKEAKGGIGKLRADVENVPQNSLGASA